MRSFAQSVATLTITFLAAVSSFARGTNAVILDAETLAGKQVPIYQDPAAKGRKTAVFLLSGEKKRPSPGLKFVKELDAGSYEITAWLAGRPVADLPFELCLQAGGARRFLGPFSFNPPRTYAPLVATLRHGGGPLTVTLDVTVGDDYCKLWWRKAAPALKDAAAKEAAAVTEPDEFELETKALLTLDGINAYTPYIAIDRLEIRRTDALVPAFDWRNDMLVALSCEGSFVSETPAPPARIEGPQVFREGKFGQGLYVGAGTGLRLPLSDRTLNRTEGTIGFWFKPDGDLKDGKYRRLLSIGNAFSLHKDQYDRLSFHIGSKHVTTQDAAWKAGTWHHVAVTWKNTEGEGDLAFYLDGDRYDIYLGRGRGLFNDEIKADSLGIASLGVDDGQLDAVIDEVVVFRRALDQEDLRALYGRGASLKEILAGKTPARFSSGANLASKKPVTGQHPARMWWPWAEFTNGEVKEFPYTDCEEKFWGTGPIWLQVDLVATQKVNMIRLWHATQGVYRDVKIATSATGAFQGEEFVVWDAAKNGTYEETSDGHLFVFPTQQARYIRCWNSGFEKPKTDKSYGQPEWREISVFCDELKGR